MLSEEYRLWFMKISQIPQIYYTIDQHILIIILMVKFQQTMFKKIDL